ncbi:Ubiquinone/menaquinone biosynthesis C-methyltransferase UbiE [Vibrio cholerae]|nr:Ubiquinone/menaquinone biosynthesis C-methyltransferase UbiE [Vibrio cholerae]
MRCQLLRRALYKLGNSVKKLAIKYISGITFLGSVAWAYFELGFEPVLVSMASASAFIGCFVTEKVKKYTYDRTLASQFYGRIAEKYDERNTQFLKESHLITVRNLKEGIKDKDNVSILDLGGGTGINVAAHFFNRTNVTWNYVDITPEMKVAFEKNALSSSFSHNAVTSDLNEFISTTSNKYDAVVISFVLTSLPYKIDMKKLVDLLSPSGVLVIADIEPQYTEKHPEYSVTVDNEEHSLSVSPVNALDLIESAVNEGLCFEYCQSIKKNDGERYAYVLRFTK